MLEVRYQIAYRCELPRGALAASRTRETQGDVASDSFAVYIHRRRAVLLRTHPAPMTN